MFFNVGVDTSIFIFEVGTPQETKPFLVCWMEDDGLATVKNKGRHDIYNKWTSIEKKCRCMNYEKRLAYIGRIDCE